jgi:hypothetical protein
MDGRSGDDLSRNRGAPPWWRTRTGLVFLGFMAIAAYFLVTEHRAHLVLAVPYLPWLLLLACPFMHHGHAGHGSGGQHPDQAADRTGGERKEREYRP